MPQTQEDKNREYKTQIQMQVGALILAGIEDRLQIAELHKEIEALKATIAGSEAKDSV
jgi:hypothetical protein